MRILLTNDDGINAPGLVTLEAIARQLSDDIWIVAPSEEQSGAGHSLTLTRPLRIRPHGERRFSVTGTPTDSVLLALGKIMDVKPDLILSGVNQGANLAEDVTYSGTVAAAMEGTLAGIRSIALSQAYSRDDAGDDVSFAAAEAWGAKVVRSLLDVPLPANTLLNVNFPAVPRGVRWTRQSFRHYDGRMVPGEDPSGRRHFWFTVVPIEQVEEGTDRWAVNQGYVSITPLRLDLTDERALQAAQRDSRPPA